MLAQVRRMLPWDSQLDHESPCLLHERLLDLVRLRDDVVFDRELIDEDVVQSFHVLLEVLFLAFVVGANPREQVIAPALIAHVASDDDARCGPADGAGSLREPADGVGLR